MAVLSVIIGHMDTLSPPVPPRTLSFTTTAPAPPGILVALNASVATAANAAYSSTASAPGSAIVRIRGDDAAVRARCPGSAAVGGPACPVAVTVSSLSSTWGATFAVVASSSGYFSLADSVAQYDVVAVGAYRFYRFFLPLTTPPSVRVCARDGWPIPELGGTVGR